MCAEVNAGEMEVRDALQAKAEFLCSIGDHAAGGAAGLQRLFGASQLTHCLHGCDCTV